LYTAVATERYARATPGGVKLRESEARTSRKNASPDEQEERERREEKEQGLVISPKKPKRRAGARD
jgi:hypothetical protein